MIQWNALMNAPNPGQSFMQAFQGARQQKMQEQQLAEDRALRREEIQAKRDDRQREEVSERWKVIGRAAQLADTPEKWDATIDQLVVGGMPEAAQYRGKFSPELRIVAMAQGGISPESSQAPSDVREYEYARSQGFQGTYMDFKNAFGPPIMVDNGDGTKTLYPRSAMGGGAMLRQQGGTPPPPPLGFVLDSEGGQSAPPTGGFPIGPR